MNNKRLSMRTLALSALLVSLSALAGCSLAPDYQKPSVAMPAGFKEAQATDGNWKPAQPSDALARGEWWTVFGDPTLNALEEQASEANQGLKAAAARVQEARGVQQQVRSGLFPQVTAGFGPTRDKPSPASQGLPRDAHVAPFTLWRAQLGLDYEVDLFGRVSSAASAAKADAEQSAALYRSVLLALQADVAQTYFQLRELDAEQQVFTGTVTLREDALKLMQRRFDEGDVSELDVARAQSELASAKSDALAVARVRALTEHSLAILLGKPPAEFSFAPQPLTPVAVQIPAGLPSALLERRPDIAAAERAMASANARIGSARAAYFPDLSLTAMAGYESSALRDLFRWSSRTFLVGPLAGTILTLPLLDGGARSGALDSAKAKYQEEVANYRQQVLLAFQDVEDSLASLRLIDQQSQEQRTVLNASSRAAKLSRLRYQEGAISYLEVIDAERSVLQSQRASTQLAGAQAVSTVNLIRALGGGWGS
jgi:multidrug efflux system outer membrane protein